VRSSQHFTERHGLIVILALGESILGIGAGVATKPMSTPILVGVVLAMAICVALWWAYFSRLARAAEHALANRAPADRGRLASAAYTHLHLMLVGGIVLMALGLEVAMAHVEQTQALGLFAAAALSAGAACYLSGTAFVARRLLGRWNATRLAVAALFVLATPLVALLSSFAALATVAAALVALLAVEEVRRATAGARSPSASSPARPTT